MKNWYNELVQKLGNEVCIAITVCDPYGGDDETFYSLDSAKPVLNKNWAYGPSECKFDKKQEGLEYSPPPLFTAWTKNHVYLLSQDDEDRCTIKCIRRNPPQTKNDELGVDGYCAGRDHALEQELPLISDVQGIVQTGPVNYPLLRKGLENLPAVYLHHKASFRELDYNQWLNQDRDGSRASLVNSERGE